MVTMRSYCDGCAAAHALDLVGERWALLVVRELLLGPKRFTDLRVGMPGASPNVLSRRLRELEGAGVVRRRKLPPPAASRVYEQLVKNDALAKPSVLYAASCLAMATGSSTKKVSGSMGNVTSHSLLWFCLATISNARSMLSACTITLKRAAPLLTWTEIFIISPHLPSA
jgi:DNA-binding HxlR family transcriptional regulator